MITQIIWLITISLKINRKLNLNHTAGNASCGPNAWITGGSKLGVGTWTGNARTDPTNYAIVYGILYPYNTSYKIYHCPEDRSTVNGLPGVQRSRSVAMSVGMNWVDGSEATPANGSFVKLNQILSPSPSKASVFFDEAANSIDNNALGIFPGITTAASSPLPMATTSTGGGADTGSSTITPYPTPAAGRLVPVGTLPAHLRTLT